MTNASNPTRFAAAGLIIRSVTVIVGGIAHSCPGIPAGGRCTVLIQGSRAAQKNKVVKVIGRGGGVVEIEFDNTEYAAQSTGTLSKKFGRKERKVKSVTIIDDDTGDEYACTGIPSDGKCAVVICDDHLPHARSPKGAADAE